MLLSMDRRQDASAGGELQPEGQIPEPMKVQIFSESYSTITREIKTAQHSRCSQGFAPLGSYLPSKVDLRCSSCGGFPPVLWSPHTGKSKSKKARSYYTCKFIFSEAACEEHDFELAARLIGREGCNLKRIKEACGSQSCVVLYEQGKGYLQPGRWPGVQEAESPLQLVMQSQTLWDLQEGLYKAQHHLKELAKHWENYWNSWGAEVPAFVYCVVSVPVECHRTCSIFPEHASCL